MIHVDRLRWRRAGGHRSPSAKVDATAEQFRARLSPTSPIEGAGLSGAAAAGGGDVSGGEAGFGGVGDDAGGGRLELKAPVAPAQHEGEVGALRCVRAERIQTSTSMEIGS
jgi:hypothetical protein